MPIKTSLDRLPIIRKSQRNPQPKLKPPETIRLPDGREIAVKDIMVKPQNKKSYNLRLGIEFGHRFKRKMVKDDIDPQEEQ